MLHSLEGNAGAAKGFQLVGFLSHGAKEAVFTLKDRLRPGQPPAGPA